MKRKPKQILASELREGDKFSFPEGTLPRVRPDAIHRADKIFTNEPRVIHNAMGTRILVTEVSILTAGVAFKIPNDTKLIRV